MNSRAVGLLRRSIGAKIIAAVMVMLLLVISLTWWSIKSSTDSYLDSVSNNSIALAETSTRDVDHRVLDQRGVLERFSQRFVVRANLSESNAWFGNLSDPIGYMEQVDENWTSVPEEDVTPFMQELTRCAVSQDLRESLVNGTKVGPGFLIFREIIVANSYGAAVAMSQKTVDYRQDDEDWWQSAWTNESYISDVMYDNHRGIHGLEVSSRIHDAVGRPLGVIMGFVDVNSAVWSTIGGIGQSLYSSGEVVLLTSDERVIFSSVPFKPLEEISTPIREQSLTGSSGSFVGEENSRARLYYFSRSEGYSDYDGYRWFLVISYDRQQVLSPLTDLRNTTLALSAIMGIVFLLGTYMLLSRSVKKPLTEFRKAAAEITHGNLDKRVHVTSRDEIGELASDFNIMTGKLQELVQDLEEKVAERTSSLEIANKELEAFSYSVSHDLRAPLRSIDGFSHALLEDYADRLDAQGKDYLARVRAGSQRMALLIDDMLKLSRMSRGKMVIGRVDLSALARSVASELQKSEPTRDVSLRIEDGIVVEGDQGLLKSVLDNLLGNAWKFTGGRKKALIEFGSQMMDGTKTFFVRDNGVGFNMAYADKLFVPFQRLHGTGEFPGTGIGLSIVQRVIRRHGGRTWAEAAVDAGATFYFTLPTTMRSLKR